MVRLLCAVFLHMQLFHEVYQGIQMMQFAKNQIEDSLARNNMLIICLMKIFSTIFTELANILLITTKTSSLEIIRSCVALRIIAEFDALYAQTIHSDSIRDRVKRSLYYDRTKENKAMHGITYTFWHFIYMALFFFYIAFYYYFMHFLTLVLNQLPNLIIEEQ